jgi:hypothetical protein
MTRARVERVQNPRGIWMLQSRDFDAVADIDRVLRDPDHDARLLPAYDSGDHARVLRLRSGRAYTEC